MYIVEYQFRDTLEIVQKEFDDFIKALKYQGQILKKYKNKFRAEQQAGAASLRTDFIEDSFDEEDDEVKIVRSKKFDIKPMYAEDACIQMELLGHDFFVFCNAETDEVNVVYKRKGNTYGLIEPEN